MNPKWLLIAFFALFNVHCATAPEKSQEEFTPYYAPLSEEWQQFKNAGQLDPNEVPRNIKLGDDGPGCSPYAQTDPYQASGDEQHAVRPGIACGGGHQGVHYEGRYAH